MKEFKLRPGIPDDAEAITAINVDGWKKAYDGIMPAAFLAEYNASPERIAHWRDVIERKDSIFVVAENNAGKVIGYLQAGPSRFEHIPDAVEIYSFYIYPNYQSCGVGKALLEKIADYYPQKTVYCCVVKENKAAQKKFEKLGAVMAPEFGFVSATNDFPVAEEVFFWGSPPQTAGNHRRGDFANPKYW